MKNKIEPRPKLASLNCGRQLCLFFLRFFPSFVLNAVHLLLPALSNWRQPVDGITLGYADRVSYMNSLPPRRIVPFRIGFRNDENHGRNISICFFSQKQ